MINRITCCVILFLVSNSVFAVDTNGNGQVGNNQVKEVAKNSKLIDSQPKIVEGTGYIVPPNVIYPSSAFLTGESGTTLVRALININGLVDEVMIKKSSGSKDLDQAAMQAIKKAHLKPYQENGVAKSVYMLIPIQFAKAM